LHRLGFPECRVRNHDPLARVEVPLAQLARIAEPEVRTELVRALKALGFLYVTVDLQGFRSGSLNEAIAPATTLPSADPPAS
jgi:uncharacterized protein